MSTREALQRDLPAIYEAWLLADEVGITRNEGTVAATVVATFFVPAGGPTRLDASAPGNCAF